MTVEGKLDVALTDDPEMAYHPNRHFPKHVIFGIRQGLTGSYHDAFAGMNPHRVKIFHIAHRDTIIETVTDDLIFYFLPPFQEFFDEDLGAVCKGLGRSFPYFFGVPACPGTQPTEGIGHA